MSHGTFGYAIERENKDQLLLNGIAPELIMRSFQDSFPKFNASTDPTAIVDIRNQGQIGSCQGQSLAKCFQICYFLATGQVINFSAMAGYILAQQYDRIRGDKGSTLSGGQKVATENGLCVEKDWPYPTKYDANVPTTRFPFKLKSAQPSNNPAEIRQALDLGLPVQTGVAWTRELDQEIVTKYTGRASFGGHSTVLWCHKNINSWGVDWCEDGCSDWSTALDEIVTYPGNTFVIYAPDEMTTPSIEEIKTYS